MLWLALRSALIFALAGIATLAMRRKSASMRHLVWLAAFVAVAAMPLFASLTPLANVQPPPATARALAPLIASPVWRRSSLPEGRTEPTPIAPVASTAPTSESYDAVVEAYVADVLTEPYRLLPVLYGLGVAFLLLRSMLALRKLLRAVLRSQRAEDLPGGIRLRMVEPGLLASPAVFGWPRATVLMPAESQSWPEERRQAAIQHELAHIERADWVWQCLALAVCTLQWFNPLAWFAAARLRAEAEGAADDAVLRKGLAASDYAQELLEVAKGIRKDTLLAVPIARPGGVAHRVRAILARDRDRSAARRPAHLAAGTGTLFSAAILGGVGLSAAVAQAPIPERNPFMLPKTEGAASRVYFTRTVEAEGEFGFDQVQVRPKGGKEQGWDLIGRHDWVDMADAPRPPEIPGRKVREFVVVCPADRALIAGVPKGAEVVQISRQKELALISASYPPTAEVTSLEVAFARSPGRLLKSLPIRRAAKPHGRTLWPRFAWFEVPAPSGKVYDRLLDRSGREIPLLGQFSPYGSAVAYLAVDAKKAGSLDMIQRHIMVEYAANFAPILLDPAPTEPTRPDAPQPTVPLEGGGRLTVQCIEAQTAGFPARRWASDGGAPRPIQDSGHRSSYIPDREPGRIGREVRMSVVWPENVPADATFAWSADAPVRSHGSGYSGSGHRYDVLVDLYLPLSQREATLHLDYGYEPWRQIVDEPVGGPKLQSRLEVGPGWDKKEHYVQVHYLPPAGYEKMDVKLEAFDAKGKMLEANSTSGPSQDNLSGKVDYQRSSNYVLSSPKQIARLRLKVRPFHRVTLPPIAMHPRP